MRSTSVSEIHAYPLRPEGFEEPLFPTAASRREVAEHLLGAPWLVRACEVANRGAGEAARASAPRILALLGCKPSTIRNASTQNSNAKISRSQTIA